MQMLATTKVKMSGSEKRVNISSIKRVTGSFWKFHVVILPNSGKEMYKKSEQSCFLLIRKKCAARAKLFFG